MVCGDCFRLYSAREMRSSKRYNVLYMSGAALTGFAGNLKCRRNRHILRRVVHAVSEACIVAVDAHVTALGTEEQ